MKLLPVIIENIRF